MTATNEPTHYDAFPVVVDATPLDGLTLQLEFDDGAAGIVDLDSIVRGPVFERLREQGFFAKAAVDADLGTVTWPGGLDISPSLLRESLVEVASDSGPALESSGQTTLNFFGKIRGSQLHYGDNLDVLRERIPDESVDLVYLDPPFNSNKNYNVLYRTPDGSVPKESRLAFRDFWVWNDHSEYLFNEVRKSTASVAPALDAFRLLLGESDLMAYLTMMTPRLVELRRVLNSTGSIYLHCDQTASHYLKVLMDSVFGAENFINNIVWLYGLGGSSARYWPRKHDDLLWYSKKVDGHFFVPDMIPATSNRMKGKKKKAPDFWDIPSINNMAKERLGYPTQKPLRLLERVVRSSSPEGGTVLDPFCGCGTTIEAAETLGRQWVGIDISYLAVEIAERRLERSFGTGIGSRYKKFGQPQSFEDAEELFEQRRLDFSYWAVGLVNADPLTGDTSQLDGVRLFPMPDGQKDGRTAVKVGDDASAVDLAAGVVESGSADLGVVVPLRHSKALQESAESLGTWTWPINGQSYPRLQVVSVEELMQGAVPMLPTAMHSFPFAEVI